MPNDYLANPLIFLIDIALGLYIGLVALRLIMQWAQWDYHNPLVRIIIRATQIPIKFLRLYIPSVGRWDSATIVLLILLTVIKILLISLLQGIALEGVLLIRWLLADIFSLFITLFSASIIIQAILSWVTPHGTDNPISPLINRMNAPLLRPIRKWLPPLAGLDLSPLIALIALQVLSMLVLPWLTG